VAYLLCKIGAYCVGKMFGRTTLNRDTLLNFSAMTIRHIFTLTLVGGMLLSSCMSSKEWVDDDVYVMKSVEIPTDTDISDESDYNAYVYNRRNNPATTSYYSQFYYTPYSMWMMRPGFYNDFGWVGNRGGYYGMGFYDPNYYDMFGYSYFYDPFWGYSTPYYAGYYGYGYPYGGYGYGYGYGYNPGYGYGGNGGGSVANHQHFSGPRGAISGYGGVRSNSAQAYKSTQAGTVSTANRPSRQTAEAVKTVSKPVSSYDRVGRNSGAPSGRTASSAAPVPSNGQTSRVTRNPGPATVGRASVPRPESTTARTVNRGAVGNAPARSRETGGSYSGSGRNQGTYSGGSAPRQSSGSSGTTGSGTSRSGSSGSSGTVTKPGRR
jgi:hypothetical protein